MIIRWVGGRLTGRPPSFLAALTLTLTLMRSKLAQLSALHFQELQAHLSPRNTCAH